MYHSLREKVVFATDFAKSREMTTPQRRYTPCSNHQAIALDGGYVDEKSQFSMRTPCFLCEARDFSVYVLNIYSPGIMKFRNSIICARIIITIYCLWSFRYPCRKCSRYYYYFFFFDGEHVDFSRVIMISFRREIFVYANRAAAVVRHRLSGEYIENIWINRPQ